MKRSNYKGRGSRKSSPKSEAKRRQWTKEEGSTPKDSKCNDSGWYTLAPQLVKDVASLSFNNPSGIEYNLQSDSANGKFINPGVMNIYVSPVPGYSSDLSSPINIAAKNFYTWIRSDNSGGKNYDPPDIIIYILAMANAFAFYSWMTRIYGTLMTYTQTNRYWGANVVRALGVDPDNIIGNLANFRAYINTFALKLSALSVPSTMSLFKRWMWMFSYIYGDEDTAKAQLYMYQPAYFYMYDEYNGAGRLVPQPLCLDSVGGVVTGLTSTQIQQYGDNLIQALIGAEDAAIMSGDILKAYGKSNIWQLRMIDESYALSPVFSEEVLTQIHNTNFAGYRPVSSIGTPYNLGWGSFNVEQDTSIGPGCLICEPVVQGGGTLQANKILDFWKTDVTPEDVIVATRNMMFGQVTYDSQSNLVLTHVGICGTEIPMYATIWNLDANGNMVISYLYHTDDKSDYNTAFSLATDAIASMSKVSYFNEHPLFLLCDYSTTAPYAEIDASCSNGELSNFTIISEFSLEKMHLSAILSEFAVPYLGNLSKAT